MSRQKEKTQSFTYTKKTSLGQQFSRESISPEKSEKYSANEYA
jgi:hypothetical protein